MYNHISHEEDNTLEEIDRQISKTLEHSKKNGLRVLVLKSFIRLFHS